MLPLPCATRWVCEWRDSTELRHVNTICCFGTRYIHFLLFQILWLDCTGWAKQREETQGDRGLVFVFGGFTVAAWVHEVRSSSCWDASLKHTNLLAAWHSHLWAVCSFRTWFQVWEEGTGKKGHASASREWLSGLRCGTQGFQTNFLLILQCVHCYPVFLHGYITHPKVSLSMLEMGWEHLWLCVMAYLFISAQVIKHANK